MWFVMTMALAAEHANHFENVDPIGEEVKVGISDVVAWPTNAKLKIELVNDTSDYLVARLDDVRLDMGTPIAPKSDKVKVVKPMSSSNKILGFEGSDLHVEKGSLVVDGLSLVSADSPVVAFPDYRLPMEKKSFKVGDFACALAGKVKQETDATEAKLKCTFTGKGVALVDESKIQVRLPDGQLFANLEGGVDADVVKPGEDFKLKLKFVIDAKVIDMQFAELQVQFNDAVRVGEPKPVKAITVPLTFSQALTDAGNK